MGIKENEGKLSYEIDFEFLDMMAERMSANKHKYPRDNWRREIEINSIKDALMRHTSAVMRGVYHDDGYNGHLSAIAANAMILNYQLKTYGKTDSKCEPTTTTSKSEYPKTGNRVRKWIRCYGLWSED